MTRWQRLVTAALIGAVGGLVLWWLIRTIGIPESGTGQTVLFWTIALGVALIYVVISTAGLWDRTHSQIARLHSQGDFRGVVEVGRALPARPHAAAYRAVDHLKVAQAGVLTGAYRTAADHAHAASGAMTKMEREGGPSITFARVLEATALMQLGLFGEATDVLASDVDRGDEQARRVAAQIAIEIGDDDEAIGLLTEPGSDTLNEAARLRNLGNLHIRRGRIEEGTRLVNEALSIYVAGDWMVDAGYCRTHLGEAALASGDGELAVEHLENALNSLRKSRPDNRPGESYVLSILGTAYAAVGRIEQAQEVADSALRLAIETESPTLIAAGHRAIAAVAAANGDRVTARSSLETALGLLSGIGARPEADKVMTTLDDLTSRE